MLSQWPRMFSCTWMSGTETPDKYCWIQACRVVPCHIVAVKQEEQTLYICHIYRISLQSSPLHNHQLHDFWPLHANLQQNDCISSTFLVIMSPWVKLKVIIIQSGIKSQGLVMSIISPSLKRIGFLEFKSKTILKAYFINSFQVISNSILLS